MSAGHDQQQLVVFFILASKIAAIFEPCCVVRLGREQRFTPSVRSLQNSNLARTFACRDRIDQLLLRDTTVRSLQNSNLARTFACRHRIDQLPYGVVRLGREQRFTPSARSLQNLNLARTFACRHRIDQLLLRDTTVRSLQNLNLCPVRRSFMRRRIALLLAATG